MARRHLSLTRALERAPLAAIAYGGLGAGPFVALGAVVLFAQGAAPWVVLVAGAVALIVALTYAEGVAAVAEPGGGAALVRRAFGDVAGFAIGWLLLLDYVVLIALAGAFAPAYLGRAAGWDALTRGPGDVLAGVGVVLAVAVVRLVRRTRLYRVAAVVAGVALAVHVVLLALGLAVLATADGLGAGVALGGTPSWGALAYALPLALLVFAGIETVANLGAEVREPGRALPPALLAGVGLTLVVGAGLAAVSASVAPAGAPPAEAPLLGVASALGAELPALDDALRVVVGLSGTVVLVALVAVAMSGAGRMTYALGQAEMLPRAFARLSRRTLIAPPAIVGVAALAAALVLLAGVADRPPLLLAGLYGSGVLLAFTAGQAALVMLRVRLPDLPRPFRAPGTVEVRGVAVPALAVVGGVATLALWVALLATHQQALLLALGWSLAGAGAYVAVRRIAHEPLLGTPDAPVPDLVPGARDPYAHILVPLKEGGLGDEVLTTAIRLAAESGARVHVLHVTRVPLERALDDTLPDEAARAARTLDAAVDLAREAGVDVEAETRCARSIGEAVVEVAAARDADLIVIGSAPRWRRQSRFFGPTVDHVLRRAPVEVMVVAYPEGALDGDGERPGD